VNTLYAAATQPSMYGERMAIVFGVATLVCALIVFFSCRTFVSLARRLGLKGLAQNKAYMSFNKFHVFYWWEFGVIAVAHVTLALFHTGLPQAGDPDAWVHWRILIFGLVSAFSGATLFSSCRVVPRLFSRATPGLSLKNKSYASYFSSHSYIWVLFLGLAAAHFLFGYLHAGIWPG
jgi:hypothetical protein